MKLFIVSHTPYYHSAGRSVGWGSTVREIDYLATLFDEVIHLAWLMPGKGNASALPHRAKNVHLTLVSPSGGSRLFDKFQVSRLLPFYAKAILSGCRDSDVVHVRCPANISMLAIVLLALMRRPQFRWVKYAGNWDGIGEISLTSRFQRWWLNKDLHRGVVTVNGEGDSQPCHVYSFLNPCLTEFEASEARRAVLDLKFLSPPIRLLFVGRMEPAKGVERLLSISLELKKLGIPLLVDIIGSGDHQSLYERHATDLGLSKTVFFHGWKPRTSLAPYLIRSHFMLLPSESEGFPKVLSEGMAYGVVPVASDVGSIPQVLSRFNCGVALPAADESSYVYAIKRYIQNPSEWLSASRAGVNAANHFTYERYLTSVQEMFFDAWSITLEN